MAGRDKRSKSDSETSALRDGHPQIRDYTALLSHIVRFELLILDQEGQNRKFPILRLRIWVSYGSNFLSRSYCSAPWLY